MAEGKLSLKGKATVVSVKVCVALVPMPLAAVKCSVKVVVVTGPGVPLRMPVAGLNVTPAGRVSPGASLRVAAGLPLAVTVKLFELPAVKVVPAALVKAGGWKNDSVAMLVVVEPPLLVNTAWYSYP